MIYSSHDVRITVVVLFCAQILLRIRRLRQDYMAVNEIAASAR